LGRAIPAGISEDRREYLYELGDIAEPPGRVGNVDTRIRDFQSPV